VLDFGERHVQLRFALADEFGRRFAKRQQTDNICPSMA
jgi:hypothetical protein